MKLNIFDKILKATVKFSMPVDCPDDLIDTNYLIIKYNLIENTIKFKNKLNSIVKKNKSNN